MGKPLKELLSSVYSLVAETIDKINQDTANPECAKQLRRIGKLAILGAEKAEKVAVKENPAPLEFDITRYFSKETAKKVEEIESKEKKAETKREADRVRLQEKRKEEKAGLEKIEELKRKMAEAVEETPSDEAETEELIDEVIEKMGEAPPIKVEMQEVVILKKRTPRKKKK